MIPRLRDDGERFAPALRDDAEQHLMFRAGQNAFRQLRNGLQLIPCGFERSNKLEHSRELYRCSKQPST